MPTATASSSPSFTSQASYFIFHSPVWRGRFLQRQGLCAVLFSSAVQLVTPNWRTRGGSLIGATVEKCDQVILPVVSQGNSSTHFSCVELSRRQYSAASPLSANDRPQIHALDFLHCAAGDGR